MSDLLEIVASLRYWMTDWDGRTMGDDELPLDWLHCGLLRQSAERISQQDAELERMRRELEEANAKIAKTRDLISWAQSDLIAEARKAAFIEAAEMAEKQAPKAVRVFHEEANITPAVLKAAFEILASTLRDKADSQGGEE